MGCTENEESELYWKGVLRSENDNYLGTKFEC
jgi:hypothetical protein